MSSLESVTQLAERFQPPQGALLPGSWTIQQPAFSGDCGVTHFLGLVVLTGRLPPSVL